mgnify:CR=1 FL=1
MSIKKWNKKIKHHKKKIKSYEKKIAEQTRIGFKYNGRDE